MKGCGGSDLRSASPSASAMVAGTRPIHTSWDITSAQPSPPSRRTTRAISTSSITASGQPNMSTSRQAPDSCIEMPDGSICGSTQSSDSNTSEAAHGGPSGPASMRHGTQGKTGEQCDDNDDQFEDEHDAAVFSIHGQPVWHAPLPIVNGPPPVVRGRYRWRSARCTCQPLAR
jgi:hypothetical protein